MWSQRGHGHDVASETETHTNHGHDKTVHWISSQTKHSPTYESVFPPQYNVLERHIVRFKDMTMRNKVVITRNKI